MESISAFDIVRLPRIIFGAGKIAELPGVMQSYGRQALIVTGGESLKKSGQWDALALMLEAAGIQYNTVSVREEPTTELIDGVAGECRKMPVNVVVSIGGGSVIDFGKAVAAMLMETGSVKDFLEGVGNKKPSGKKVPFIAVPTTAGTGSEATKNAVVCDRKEGYKRSLRHDNYMPDVALVDPELTLTSPRHITAACGFDAFSQLIESYTSTKANFFTDSLALKALSLAAESLPELVLGQGKDVSLREKMSYAAMVSGITLSYAGLGAVHGMAGPLGGLVAVPHGVACGNLLFPVMSFVVKKIIEEKNIPAQKRFADIGRLFIKNQSCDDLFCCEQFLCVLQKWTQIMKFPSLSHFGMKAADIEKIILPADSKNSFAVLSKEEMRIILEIVC